MYPQLVHKAAELAPSFYRASALEAQREARAILILQEALGLAVKPAFCRAAQRRKLKWWIPKAEAEPVGIYPKRGKPMAKLVKLYVSCDLMAGADEGRRLMEEAERLALIPRFALPMPYGKVNVNIMRNRLTYRLETTFIRMCFYGVLFELEGRLEEYRQKDARVACMEGAAFA